MSQRRISLGATPLPPCSSLRVMTLNYAGTIAGGMQDIRGEGVNVRVFLEFLWKCGQLKRDETVDAACVGGCSLVFTPVALVIRLTIN